MRYRPLGTSGLVVSVVGLGCNNFGRAVDLDGTRAVVDAALDAGVTLLDTADVYGNRGGSESLLGEALKGRREQVVLATKFGMDMGGANGPDWGARGSRRYVRRAVEASLERLQTDWIDLYQYHAPDGVTPIEETLAALDELVTEGKVRYVGSSNFAGWQVADAEAVARRDGVTRFVSAQNSYSLLDRTPERELVPACAHYGVGILPYFPLANGLLTGKYRRGEPPPEGTRLAARGAAISDRSFDAVEALEQFAIERGRTLLDVAIAGLAALRAVGSVIAGATRPAQVQANAAAGDWQPTAEDLAALNAIVRPMRAVR
ncbi:MAG TPA: aldo/keto reductase [Acidimicrobiia bacterium]|jgi:aryl-alcohol dehydrogenase-like predicted oxidoreductase